MRKALFVEDCEECMKLRHEYFCRKLKKHPRPDSTGFDPLCPLKTIRGYFQ